MLKFIWDMSAFSKQDTYFCKYKVGRRPTGQRPNIMTKFSFLLFLCLLFFGNLFAQTDSTRPLPVPSTPVQTIQDTSVRPVMARPRHDSVRHLTHRDSVRRDSIVRHRAAVRRDSLAAIAHTDSLRADSVAHLASSTPAASTPAVSAAGTGATPTPVSGGTPTSSDGIISGYDGPPLWSFWNKVLTLNPYYNFLGKPIAEPYEIHQPESKDSFFYLIIGILFYFALVRIFFEKYFNNLMTLFFRVSLRQQQIREQVLQTPLPSLLLNILFIITGGLYACFLLHYSTLGADINFWLLYLNCMMLLAAIYLVKFLVLKFGGWVFSIARATDTYIFIVFLVNKMLGIFLLPFLIVITFSGDAGRQVFITMSLAMVFVLWMYRVLAAYRPVRNEIKLTPFHFFLYLCAFEIAPLLLIYKVLLSYLEKVY
jgi:hypothetical protein